MDPRGTHVLIDLYGCRKMPDRPRRLLFALADIAELKVLGSKEHVFPGGGATAVVLLSASHASIHTWPERKYVSMDLYSCKRIDIAVVERVMARIRQEFEPMTVGQKVMERGEGAA